MGGFHYDLVLIRVRVVDRYMVFTKMRTKIKAGFIQIW